MARHDQPHKASPPRGRQATRAMNRNPEKPPGSQNQKCESAQDSVDISSVKDSSRVQTFPCRHPLSVVPGQRERSILVQGLRFFGPIGYSNTCCKMGERSDIPAMSGRVVASMVKQLCPVVKEPQVWKNCPTMKPCVVCHSPRKFCHSW